MWGWEGKLTGVFDVDTDTVVEGPLWAEDVEICNALFLDDSIGFDGESVCVSGNANATSGGGRVEVVDFFTALVADPRAGIR